jgi:hypothetical protein
LAAQDLAGRRRLECPDTLLRIYVVILTAGGFRVPSRMDGSFSFGQ